MPDLPEEAVQAAAVAIERELMSGTDYSMASDSDEALARVALEAAAPVLAAQVRRDLLAAARSCSWCGEIHEKNPDDHAYFQASQEAAAWLARQIGEARG